MPTSTLLQSFVKRLEGFPAMQMYVPTKHPQEAKTITQ